MLQLPVLWRQVNVKRDHVRSWCDAAGGAQVAGCIICIQDVWYWTRWVCPDELIQQFIPRGDNYIGLLELIGVVLTWTTFKVALKGSYWTCYCDNSGVVHSTTSGVAHGMVSQDANNIIGRLWMEMASSDTAFYIAQVETAANGSDEVTRVENSKLVEELGATWMEPCIPEWFNCVWRVPDMNMAPGHHSEFQALVLD